MALDATAESKIESARFIVLGNVDAGKSSFISVMTNKILDDGNGAARKKCVSSKQELETGRTSKHKPYYLVENNEITTLIDLCGHEKYFGTTAFGITALFADFGILVIGANMGLVGMVREHLGLLITRRIPFLVVISKVDDICPEHVLQSTINTLNATLIKNKRTPEHVENLTVIPKIFEDGFTQANDKNLKFRDNFRRVPIVKISNKTGLNIDELRNVLCQIRSRTYLEAKNIIPKVLNSHASAGIFYIDTIFNVRGVGLVLSGTNKYAQINVGQKLYLGPVGGEYVTITIKSMHNSIRENVTFLRDNEAGSIGIRFESKHIYARSMFNKGQVAVTDVVFAKKHTTKKFKAIVVLPNHGTTIRHGYQSTIHCRTTRQAARLITEEPASRTPLEINKETTVSFEFLKKAELILPGTTFIFRDGKTKGFGQVTELLN
jgi:elongation factor 1-alpha